MINAIIDPLLDRRDMRRLSLVPLTYVLFHRATSILRTVGDSTVMKDFETSLASNMLAMARESEPEASVSIDGYRLASQNCELLGVAWRVLVSRDKTLDETYGTFLESHKMFDDLHDLVEDFRTGQYSLLLKNISQEITINEGTAMGEFIGRALNSSAISDHCDRLHHKLSACLSVFATHGMISLSELVRSRAEFVRTFVARKDSMAAAIPE